MTVAKYLVSTVTASVIVHQFLCLDGIVKLLLLKLDNN